METWRVVAGVLIALFMGLVGVALATNYRGVTEWHVRRSAAAAGVLRRVPPWRWLPDADADRRMARFVLLGRGLGVLFAAAGVVALVVELYSVVSGEPLPSNK
ncbi:hypothetical protein [Micromonospora sediminicola]|uniref:hypothetical protein n=1 Tax=Micromonospora sediminicola TaxID=946078 RepID=UPI0037AA9211